MAGVEQLQQQDYYANQDSILHNIDGRVKLIFLVLIIVYAVTTTSYTVLLILELYLLLLIVLSKISLKDALIRVLLILPFGFFIAIFQPFIQPGEIIYTLPLGLTITREGLAFGEILLVRLAISITAVVLFSYITPMYSIAESLRRLHVPNEFAMIFSLFVRFIFLFYDELENIRRAQTSRGFSYTNNTPYRWKIKQTGSLFLMMFLKAYERGEVVYNSMASRGYNSDSTLYQSDESLSLNSILYIVIPIVLIVIHQLLLNISII
ncbi:MAG: cobalt ECF transporter T component CbiQ [Methanosphaera sp.]|nr:cobalt ECF transporter T component CbiQ [Methanosphaera sp.]